MLIWHIIQLPSNQTYKKCKSKSENFYQNGDLYQNKFLLYIQHIWNCTIINNKDFPKQLCAAIWKLTCSKLHIKFVKRLKWLYLPRWINLVIYGQCISQQKSILLIQQHIYYEVHTWGFIQWKQKNRIHIFLLFTLFSMCK